MSEAYQETREIPSHHIIQGNGLTCERLTGPYSMGHTKQVQNKSQTATNLDLSHFHK